MATIIPATWLFDSHFFSLDEDDCEQDTNGGPHKLSLNKNVLSGNLAKVKGIWPWRWLFERLSMWRLVSFPSEYGTFPRSWLKERFSLSNFTRFPREDGISPEREFLLRSRITWSSVSVLNSGGIGPAKKLLESLSS